MAASTPSASTRDRIVDEAVRLFARQGYAGTSVAEIEEAAGLTPGAGGLYHHFKSKAAVLEVGIERHLGRLEALRDVRRLVPATGSLRAELTLIAHYVFLELRSERELVRLLLSESGRRPD